MSPPSTPRVFISYSHDSQRHKEQVLELVKRLRDDGVDCRLDANAEAPAQGWPAWMDQELELADFVLVVSTAGYKAKSRVGPGWVDGRGARFESVLVLQDLYESGMWNERIVPVLLGDARPQDILRPLRPYSYYRADTEPDYERLYRRLTGQREHIAPSRSASDGNQQEKETPKDSRGHAFGKKTSKHSDFKTRLEGAGVILAVVVAVLTILGAFLDFPAKWRSAWSDADRRAIEKFADERPKASYKLRLIHGSEGSPVVGVNVAIPKLGMSTTTDGHGVAHFLDLPVEPGSMLRMRASHEDFEAREQEVTVGTEGMDQWRLKPVVR